MEAVGRHTLLPRVTLLLAFVFLRGGVAEWLEVSFLLAAMVMGATVYRLASHHRRPFHEVEHIDRPFKVLFFILAGASLHLGALIEAGYSVVAYILLRILGKLAGAATGGYISGADRKVRRWLGPALLPQAGEAMGMVLVAAQRFPELSESILAIAMPSVQPCSSN